MNQIMKYEIIEESRRFILGHIEIWFNNPSGDSHSVNIWPLKEKALADAKLIQYAPDLLSELIQAVSACECYMRLNGETEMPAWCVRAKSAIEAALNLKTVEK